MVLVMRRSLLIMIMLVLSAVSLPLITDGASAHSPAFPGNNTSLANATLVENPSKSSKRSENSITMPRRLIRRAKSFSRSFVQPAFSILRSRFVRRRDKWMIVWKKFARKQNQADGSS